MREVLLAAAVLAASPVPALAGPCLPRAELEQRLALQSQESPAFAGVASNDALLRVYVRRDGSTWTVALELPNGLLCVMAAGKGWRAIDDKHEGEGA